MLRMFLILTLLTGGIYPLVVTCFAKLMAPHASRGSLIEHKGVIVGSLLLAQKFKDPKYFWPRASFNDYKLPSGGSNYALTNAKLKKEVEKRGFTSGSGFDPHITLEAARHQVDRIAEARHLNKDIILRLIEDPYVNVLLLNIALDGIHE